LKVAVLAPTSSSLYSRLAVHLIAQEKGLQILGIVVRTPWNMVRIRDELKRDGSRLIKKVINKWILREQDFTSIRKEDTLYTLARRLKLIGQTLNDLSNHLNIPLIMVKDHNDFGCISFLQKIEPDVIVFTGGGLVREDLLKVPRLGVLNCHSGWLPDFRGMDVIEWALLDAKEVIPKIGLSLHFMDKGVDTGPILFQKKFELRLGDSFDIIRQRMQPIMVNMILDGLCRLRDDTIQAEPQKKDAGKQYFVMHPRLSEYANKILKYRLELTNAIDH